VRAYVWLFDGESDLFLLVFPARRRLQSDITAMAEEMRSEEMVCTALADVLPSMVVLNAVRTRVHHPKDT